MTKATIFIKTQNVKPCLLVIDRDGVQTVERFDNIEDCDERLAEVLGENQAEESAQ